MEIPLELLMNLAIPIGYGKNNQAVLIPAFLSAYSGKNAETISLNAITDNPLTKLVCKL